MKRFVLWCLALLIATSCARMQESPPSFSTSTPSSYSAPFSQASQSFAVPAHEPVTADVVVRPDLLAMNFAVRTGGKSPEAALEKSKGEVETLRAKIRELAGERNAPVIRLCGFRSERESEEKARAFIDGVVEIPLEAGADYWTRAALMARLSLLQKVEQPSKKALSASGSESEEEPAIVGVSAPRFLVRDTEKYRAELTKKWVERARAFASIAEEGRAGLNLVRCEPPQAIGQNMISFEEIALSLRMACQLDAVQR
jgi:hypothetical protein